jgi:hypothetical protein
MNRLLLIFVAIIPAVTGCISHHFVSGQNSTTSTQANFDRSHNQGAGAPQWQGPDRLTLTYRIDRNSAVLDSDRLTLIFPNLSAGELSSFSFQGGELHIQVGGDGVSESTVSGRRNRDTATFHSHYENGTNTIQFFGRTVKLANQAHVIIVNNVAVSPPANDNTKQIVHIR